MARKKNTEKRNEILTIAYQMFSDKEYDQVFIKDIASEANISKALFQHYFVKKSDLIDVMLKDLLDVSFQYVDEIISKQQSIYLRLSLYSHLFFDACTKEQHLYKFITHVISDKTLLRSWISIIYEWLIQIRNEEMESVTSDQFQTALAFGVSGGTELLLQYEKWNITVHFISEQMVTSFMRILNTPQSSINQVIETTNTLIKNIHTEDFITHCNQEISWFRSEIQ